MKIFSKILKSRPTAGFLEVDLMVALAILTIAVMPLGYAFARERKALRLEYQHAVINEIVDGEMEILSAGAARKFPDGSQDCAVNSRAAQKLPKGQFQLTKNGRHLRLEWRATEKCGLAPVIREATLK